MLNIRANDTVQVRSGDDRGKRARVLRVMPDDGMALVEGIHLVYKHQRKNPKNPQGGRLQKESPIRVETLMLVCPHCDKPTRTGRAMAGEGKDAGKRRVCRKCKKEIV